MVMPPPADHIGSAPATPGFGVPTYTVLNAPLDALGNFIQVADVLFCDVINETTLAITTKPVVFQAGAPFVDDDVAPLGPLTQFFDLDPTDVDDLALMTTYGIDRLIGYPRYNVPLAAFEAVLIGYKEGQPPVHMSDSVDLTAEIATIGAYPGATGVAVAAWFLLI